MEEHVTQAKAHLAQAKTQYKTAQKLYKSALELQKTFRPYETQAEAAIRVPSRAEFSIDDAALNVTDTVVDANDNEQLSPTFCKVCETSLLVTCFTENTWPGSKRITLCNLLEATSKRHKCALCRFLVESSRLIQASQPSATVLPTSELTVTDQVRIVQGSRDVSWPKIAGCALEVSVNPFAWLELVSQPRINVEEASYVCITLEPSNTTLEDQIPSEVYGPRLRSSHEQSTGLVDYDLIKSWLHTCRTSHGPKCANLGHVENEVPTPLLYLIDLKTRKIEPAQPGTSYVAVSYVCGDDAAPGGSDTTVPSADDGEQLGSLNNANKFQLPATLPRTLEDALTLTEAIGEQFVWIDKYCIDQENILQLEQQITNMDKIYRQASLTIIALASDDANSGIPGVSCPMKSRIQPTLALPQGGKLIATRIEFTREYAGRLPWDQRAWTMQEFVLSRRCLIFSSYHVSMMCQEEFFHDTIPVNTALSGMQTKLDTEHYWENVYGIDLTGKAWDFKAFDGLISVYSGRQLRYQSDILRACQGTLHQITQRTGMTFAFGMPISDIHRALLWKAHNDVCLKRRTWYDEDSRSQVSLPSWTWAGWQGRIECDYWIGDLAGYIDHVPRDGTRVLNRKGRKRARVDDPTSVPQRDLGHADILSVPCHMGRPCLRLSSYVAKCKVQLVRGHHTPYAVYKNGASRALMSIGDHWTLLEPGTGYKMQDIAGNEVVFEKRDHFFRTDSSTSDDLVQACCNVELLMISHWSLIRDSERSKSTWLQDMVSCLVTLRNNNRTLWRIAAILLEAEVWERFKPVLTEVDLA